MHGSAMLRVARAWLVSAAVEFADAVGANAVGEVEAQFLVQEGFRLLPDVVAIPHIFAIGANGDVTLLGFVFGEQGEEFLDRFFVFAGLRFGRAEEFGVEQGAVDGGGQIIQMAFLDKIGDTGDKFVNLHLPIQRIGDKDEGDIRAFLVGNSEGGEAIKRWQAVIGEDDIRGMRGQGLQELVAGFDAAELEFESVFVEGAIHGVRIGGDIFHENDGDLLVHGGGMVADETADVKAKGVWHNLACPLESGASVSNKIPSINDCHRPSAGLTGKFSNL